MEKDKELFGKYRNIHILLRVIIYYIVYVVKGPADTDDGFWTYTEIMPD